MAEGSPLDRLQPFLLDRLTDEEPTVAQERPERRAMTARRYRESVLRDLTWLLNSKSHPPADRFEEYKHAAKSVINYGMPDVAGITGSSVNAADMERMVRNAILQFEPRIVRHTLVVRVVGATSSDQPTAGHTISLEIRGDIKLLPVPEPIFVKTNVDLETGHCELQS